MMRKAVIAIAILVIGASAVMGSLKVYYMRDDDSDARLLRRGDEGYVFIGTNRRGWSGSYLWSLGVSLKEYFGVVIPPKAAKPSVVVLRLTPEGVQSYVATGFELGSYTPFQNNIFVRSNGALWKWVGTHFEEATAEEQRRFDDSISRDSSWSETTNVLSRAGNKTEFPLELAGNPLILVARRDAGRKSIDLQQPNQPPQTIWSIDERPRRVTKAEYEREFPTSL